MLINALDPNLATLASNAAVEVDLSLNGEATDFESVLALKECLKEILDKPNAGEPALGLHADTETQTILGQAFIAAGADHSSILSELIQKTDELVGIMGSADKKEPELEWLRSFCLALSKRASSFRQLVMQNEPEDPNRR